MCTSDAVPLYLTLCPLSPYEAAVRCVRSKPDNGGDPLPPNAHGQLAAAKLLGGSETPAPKRVRKPPGCVASTRSFLHQGQLLTALVHSGMIKYDRWLRLGGNQKKPVVSEETTGFARAVPLLLVVTAAMKPKLRTMRHNPLLPDYGGDPFIRTDTES